MKKCFLIGAVLLFLFGCSPESKQEADPNVRYFDLISLIREYDSFQTSSNYFDINVENAVLADGGYRFYVTIDNARVAIYDLEAIAIEEGVDYSRTMAANIGIFEDAQYNMVPNQANPEKGYYKGVVASATTDKPTTTLHILVQWKNKDLSVLHREFFELTASYTGVNE